MPPLATDACTFAFTEHVNLEDDANFEHPFINWTISTPAFTQQNESELAMAWNDWQTVTFPTQADLLWRLMLTLNTTEPDPKTSDFDKSWKAMLIYGYFEWDSDTTPDMALQNSNGSRNTPSCMDKYVGGWDLRDPVHPQRPRLCFFPCSGIPFIAEVADNLEG
jgi:hypothetical protein